MVVGTPPLGLGRLAEVVVDVVVGAPPARDPLNMAGLERFVDNVLRGFLAALVRGLPSPPDEDRKGECPAARRQHDDDDDGSDEGGGVLRATLLVGCRGGFVSCGEFAPRFGFVRGCVCRW